MVEHEHTQKMDEDAAWFNRPLPLRARGMTPTPPSDRSEVLEAHLASIEERAAQEEGDDDAADAGSRD